MFRRNMSPPSSGRKNKARQETRVRQIASGALFSSRKKYFDSEVSGADFLPWSEVRSESLNVAEYANCLLEAGVGIATGHGLDGPSSIAGSARFFSAPQCPHRLWGPTQPSIQWVPRALSPGGVKLRTHLHVVSRSGEVELYLQSPIRLHGIVLN
jgi:hypothetical protein